MFGSPAKSMRIGCVGFADVEQQTVAPARAAGQPDVRIDRDVVALVRTDVGGTLPRPPPPPRRRPPPRRQPPRRSTRRAAPAAPHRRHLPRRTARGTRGCRSRAAGAPAPRPRPRAACSAASAADRSGLRGAGARPVKMRARSTIAAFCGAVERHLDDFDPELRRIRIVGVAVDAARHFFRRPDARAARNVDVDVVFVARMRRRTVCVCEPRQVWTLVTSFGFCDVRDVEDADAAHALLAHRHPGTPPNAQSRAGCPSTPTT